MGNDTLVLGLIGGSLMASLAYMYSTAKKADVKEEKFLAQQGGADAWLKDTNVQYIPKDQVLLNALDSLAVYRYVDQNIQFNKVVNEIELFYSMFVHVMASKSGRDNPKIIAHGAQYIINIKTHMLGLKRLVLEKYPAHQRDLLDRRLDNRIEQVYALCNSYYLNFIKEAKCPKVQNK